MNRSNCANQDLVGSKLVWLVWWFPTALIVLGAFLPVARAAIWIPCFALMGLACLVNARRCGRLHCHITGPLFLLAGVATALDAFAIASIDWKLVLGVVALGTVLGYGLEWARGKYASIL